VDRRPAPRSRAARPGVDAALSGARGCARLGRARLRGMVAPPVPRPHRGGARDPRSAPAPPLDPGSSFRVCGSSTGTGTSTWCGPGARIVLGRLELGTWHTLAQRRARSGPGGAVFARARPCARDRARPYVALVLAVGVSVAAGPRAAACVAASACSRGVLAPAPRRQGAPARGPAGERARLRALSPLAGATVAPGPPTRACS
jgi:hypothetical protein